MTQQLQHIEGTWAPYRSRWENQETPEDELRDVTLTFAEGRCEVHRAGALLRHGTYTTDTSTTPHRIDVTFKESDVEELTDAALLGIYERAEDCLCICYGPPGGARPGEFWTEPKSGKYLGEYRLIDERG